MLKFALKLDGGWSSLTRNGGQNGGWCLCVFGSSWPKLVSARTEVLSNFGGVKRQNAAKLRPKGVRVKRKGMRVEQLPLAVDEIPVW